MKVLDVLIGETGVLVETNNGDYRYDRDNTGSAKIGDNAPECVREALEEEGLLYPVSKECYMHDELHSGEREELADSLGLSEESGVFNRLEGIFYEANFTVEVRGPNEVVVTKFQGNELKEPIEV